MIPAITVPVVLLGTFGILALLGYSVNTLTLFAMVLAIGLLVDDAIVVVENVERVDGGSAIAAARGDVAFDAGDQWCADRHRAGTFGGICSDGIFRRFNRHNLPTVFHHARRRYGAVGVGGVDLDAGIVRRFAKTVGAAAAQPFFRGFNRLVEYGQRRYGLGLNHVMARKGRFCMLALLLVGFMTWQYLRMPTGFLPVEDQGSVMVQFSLPPGAPMARTQQTADAIADYFMTAERDNLNVIFMVVGRNNAGSGQNVGMAFAELKHWSLRSGNENNALAIISRANRHFKSYRDAQINVLSPPAVRGLGQSSGFELWLQDQNGVGHDALQAAQRQVIAAAAEDPLLTAVRINGLEDKAQLQVDIDQQRPAHKGCSRLTSPTRFLPPGALILTILSIAAA